VSVLTFVSIGRILDFCDVLAEGDDFQKGKHLISIKLKLERSTGRMSSPVDSPLDV
jgi:hypothetical protein